MNKVKKNCKFCSHYNFEEVGDSDHGAIYGDELVCDKLLDFDEDSDDTIPDFDRDIGRTCCELDFWKVLEEDDELCME